jgi:cytochrome c556
VIWLGGADEKNQFLPACVLIGCAAVATAHTGATGVTLERMQGMTAMADAMKALAPSVRGLVAHDPNVVVASAAVLGLHSGSTMVDLFEEGTGVAPSQAAASVWSDPEDFADLADQLEVLALELTAASASPENTAALFTQIGRTCAGCHQDNQIKSD